MWKRLLDNGVVIPVPNPWLPTLRLRLLRWDLDPSDRRVGLTIQIEF